MFISNAKPIVKIVAGMRQKGYGGQFATSSFAGSRVVTDLKEHARGLIMTQVLPRPNKDHLQLHREFHAGLKLVAANSAPNNTMLDGYIAGRLLVDGLRRTGNQPSRAQLLAALEGLSELNYGGYPLSFSRDNHQGSRFVDLGVVTARGDVQF